LLEKVGLAVARHQYDSLTNYKSNFVCFSEYSRLAFLKTDGSIQGICVAYGLDRYSILCKMPPKLDTQIKSGKESPLSTNPYPAFLRPVFPRGVFAAALLA
jgi:hypothetical protein